MAINIPLQALAQIRYMHWMTTNYVVHKELGNLYERIDPLIDRFVESYLGTHKAGPVLSTLSLKAPTTQEPYSAIIKEIKGQFKELRGNLDSALQNIIDEITGAIDQTVYLLEMA
jgi:DNA-binding ferritin-like protein